MIKSILHFLKIHWKVISGNSAVIVENMLGVAPKSFNPVNMVLVAAAKGLTMIQPMMLAPALEGIVASEGVRVVDRPLSGALADMSHQFIGCHPFHDFGVDPSVPLQKAQNNAFTSSAASAPAFPSAAEIALVYLNLTLEFARFKLRDMVDRLTQTLVDAGHHLIIQGQIAGNAIGRLLLVKVGDDANLFAQPPERFLFSTVGTPAFHITAQSSVDFERTAENTLSTPQKVGRTVENALLTSNHKDILAPRGYEIH